MLTGALRHRLVRCFKVGDTTHHILYVSNKTLARCNLCLQFNRLLLRDTGCTVPDMTVLEKIRQQYESCHRVTKCAILCVKAYALLHCGYASAYTLLNMYFFFLITSTPLQVHDLGYCTLCPAPYCNDTSHYFDLCNHQSRILYNVL